MHFLNKPVAAICLTIAAAAHAEEAAYDFNIPPQQVSQVLDALAQQTGLQPFYADDSVKNLHSDGVRGRYVLRDAVGKALAGTGLTFQFTAEKSVAIRPAPAAEKMTEMSAIEVRGAAERAYQVRQTTSATRTVTRIEEIPQSVVSVPRAILEDQGAKTMSDALRNVSNVNSVDARDSNNVGFRIRGFGSALVVDGVAMPGYFPNQESLVNVERIDVVKGPAGALFGSSQGVGTSSVIGGTIAMTTRAPSATPVRDVGVKFGDYGQKGVTLDFNQPLSSTLALRLDGEVQDSKSETDRVFFKRQALFPSLAYRPDADTEMIVRLRSLDNSTLDYSGLPVTGTLNQSTFSTPRNRILTAEGLPESTNKSQGVNFQLNKRLADSYNFSMLTAYNQTELDQRGVYSLGCGAVVDAMMLGVGTPDNQCLAAGVRLWDKFSTWTVSPSLTHTIEGEQVKHVITAGLDYETTKDDAYMAVSDPFGSGPSFFGLLSMTTVDLLNPVYPAWSDPVAPATPDQQNRYYSTAVYVQDQATVNAKLHLLGSLRYSRVKVKDVGGNPALGFSQNNDTTNSSTTPRVGATYEFTDKFSAFAGYGEGFKVPTGSVFVSPPKPEEAKQTEVGLRLRDANGVTATLSIFDLVRRNVSVSAGMGLSRQAGEQRSTGVDMDLVWQATNDLRWLASWSSQNARITQDSVIPVDSKLFNVPQHTLHLAARYDVHGGNLQGIGLGLGVVQNSRLAGDNSNTFFTPASTVWDAQVSYTKGSVRMGVNVANLTDSKYYVPINYFSGGVIPAQPRTVTATASIAF